LFLVAGTSVLTAGTKVWPAKQGIWSAKIFIPPAKQAIGRAKPFIPLARKAVGRARSRVRPAKQPICRANHSFVGAEDVGLNRMLSTFPESFTGGVNSCWASGVESVFSISFFAHNDFH
jgi:hypothetical protein